MTGGKPKKGPKMEDWHQPQLLVVLEIQPHLRSEVIASFGTSTFLRHTVELVKS